MKPGRMRAKALGVGVDGEPQGVGSTGYRETEYREGLCVSICTVI